MILRRITEHVKAQNWFAVGLDFFIVVVGVFIGIQVSNLNAARADRATEAQYLQDLYTNIVEDRDEFANVDATNKSRVSALNYVLTETSGEVPPAGIILPTGSHSSVATTEIPIPVSLPPAKENLSSLWAVMNFARGASPQFGTYNALINSGDIGLIRNHEIVNALHSYYDLAAGLERVQDDFFSMGDDGLIGAGRRVGLSPFEPVHADRLIALASENPEFGVMLRQARQQVAIQSRLMEMLDWRAEAIIELLHTETDQ
jgi:hypothetical protein